MKKLCILFIIAIILGISFTFLFLNKENTYAKENYMVFAFQAGAYSNKENAINFANNLPSTIIIQDNNLYRVYVAIYKNIDIVNKMLVYFENNNINIYLKNINVDKKFYNLLDKYESLINETGNNQVYDKINQSVLNTYQEGTSYDENNKK